MKKCSFCETEFMNSVEKYCCYWCELHGEIEKSLIKRLKAKQKILEATNNPKIALGLSEAILIVKSEFYTLK